MFLRRKMALLGLLVTCCCVGLAVAQESETNIDVVKVAPLSNEGPDEPTPAQQTEQAKQILAKARQTCNQQAKMLNGARQDRDIIRATCLDDKLTQCNANLTTLQARIAAHGDAADAGDSSRRNHEYTVITVLAQKFSALAQAANQCIGQDIFDTGDTTVTTEVDPGSPDEDPTVVPTLPDNPVPFIPPPVSGVN